MTDAPEYRIDRDLVGQREAIFRHECGKAFIELSPAMHSLLLSDKFSMMDSLKVKFPDGTLRPLMDIQEGNHG